MNDQDIKTKLERQVVGQCACQKVRRAARIITRAYDVALRPVGIKVNQFTMLSVIALAEGLSLTMLAEKIGLERTTLIRNLNPLERDGLVTICDQSRTRARSATITQKGRALLHDALPLWKSAQDDLKSQFGDANWNAMLANIDSLADTSSDL